MFAENLISPTLTRVPTGSESVIVSHMVTHDVDDHAALYFGWNMSGQQIGSGAFCGDVCEVRFGKTQLVSAATTQHVHHTGSSWPGSLVFAVACSAKAPVRYRGHAMGASDAVSFSGQDEFDVIAPEGSEILTLAVDSEDFQRYAKVALGENMSRYLLGRPQLICSPTEHAHFAELLVTTIRKVANQPQLLMHEPAQAALRETLFAQIVELLIDQTESPAVMSAHHHAELVANVSAYAQTHVGEMPTVAELCRVFKVSRRTLQYAFDDVVGMNPVAYLRALRLNLVRKAIKEFGATASLHDLAKERGFGHPSYFSAHYKKLFGELPSATLLRQAGRTSPLSG